MLLLGSLAIVADNRDVGSQMDYTILDCGNWIHRGSYEQSRRLSTRYRAGIENSRV